MREGYALTSAFHFNYKSFLLSSVQHLQCYCMSSATSLAFQYLWKHTKKCTKKIAIKKVCQLSCSCAMIES